MNLLPERARGQASASGSRPQVLCSAGRRRGHVRPRAPPSGVYVPPRPTGPSGAGEEQVSASEPCPDLLTARHSLERMFHLSELFTPVGNGVLYSDGGAGNFPQFVPQTQFLLVETPPGPQPQKSRNNERSPDYFANVGDAIRTLREDIPLLFQRDLNYEIYREDIVFRDPRNCFKGMKNYQTIFWSLQFHGKIFFKTLYVDVKRIWQPDDSQIKMRWTVHGIPRVPWEAEGTFDGISTYRLDHTGRIYEHCVDNVLLRDPPMATNPPLLAGLNLVPTGGETPVPGAWFRRIPQLLGARAQQHAQPAAANAASSGGAASPESCLGPLLALLRSAGAGQQDCLQHSAADGVAEGS